MKRMMLSVCILLLLGAFALAGMNKQQTPGDQDEKPVPKKYVVHLKNGGKIETNNYTVEGNRLKLVLQTGQIYLDRSIVKSVEEVKGVEETPVQTIPVSPAGVKPLGPPTGTRPTLPPAVRKEPPVPVDDNGHDEGWWKERVDSWKKKREEALARYNKGEEQWNTYNGLLQTIDPSTVSQYEITKYQDMRGAGRTDMDAAQADIDEADRMLNQELPEEARKAGAPPGWAR